MMVTSGAIEALELVSKTFLDPGDTVVVEGPTYLGAIMAFRGFQANVVAVPMDAEGLRVAPRTQEPHPPRHVPHQCRRADARGR